MLRSNTRIRLALLAGLLLVAPACSSSAGGVRDGRGLGARFADRLAYRPVYPEPSPVPNTRPLFLSGYAGAQYPSRRNVAPQPVYPSTYQYVPSPWLSWLHRGQP